MSTMVSESLGLPCWCSPVILAGTAYPGDIVFVRYNTVYVIVRRLYGDTYLAIPKYIRGLGPWRTVISGQLKRIITTYSPRSIHGAAALAGAKLEKTPQFSTNVPIVKLSDSDLLLCTTRPPLSPLELLEAERIAPGVWSQVYRFLNELADCVKPTGSLLQGSFTSFSDVDLIVDISRPRCLSKLVEFMEYMQYRSRSPPTADIVVVSEASERNIPVELVRRLLRPWTKLSIEGRRVSLSIADFNARLEPLRVIVETSKVIVDKVVDVEPYQQTLGDFPAIAVTNDGSYIVIYDGLFVPLVFEGGKLRVRGLKACLKKGDECLDAIVIGVREVATFIDIA
ncbi:hypothetical protein Hbut_1271 [Hyperthermus butylicus DSM 5456]|uniref:Uncharacterized protein n=2 Tax=Hyperthermus butylicus TaxID=54248 RepID=A2BM92_HYPBU|nr:hypothetical protein Hbut_1271 [Hyperthermus butylicus DSM 5456]